MVNNEAALSVHMCVRYPYEADTDTREKHGRGRRQHGQSRYQVRMYVATQFVV